MSFITVTGILTNPSGTVLSGYNILFEAIRTSDTVVNNTSVTVVTDNNGAYSFELGYGTYTLKIKSGREARYSTVASNILIYSQVLDNNSIQQIILAQADIEDVNEDLITQLLQIKADVLLNAQNASTSETNAAASAASALASKNAAAASATSASSSAATATTKASASASSATSASSSAATATTKASEAASSATSASSSATSATASATSASSSAATATTKASEAATSATTATTKATEAANSATSAANSASTATTKAAEALSSANSAANSASIATTKASEASTSASEALASKQNAATSEANADISEANALASANTASTAANTATVKASEAATSATSAATSASTATTKATAATISATNAATSEANALASANTATTKAAEAATSASDASTSEANAATSEANALASANTATTKASEAASSAANALASEQAAAQYASSISGGIVENGNVDLSSGIAPTPISNGLGGYLSTLWKVTVAGTINSIDYAVGDSIVYSKTTDSYYKIDSTDQVTSVNGMSGAVTITNISGNSGTATKLETSRSISVTGDATWTVNFDGSVNTSAVLTLANTGVTAGTYKSVTVDSKGRVTSATNPTTLSGFGITDAQPLDSDLTALAGLASNGIIVRTATGAATTRSIAVSGNGVSITNADGVVGNPSITINSASTNTASTLVFRDTNGDFSANTITANLSGNSTTASSLQTARTISISSDATGSVSFNGSQNVNIALTLANTGVTAGTYKSVTVDAKGRVTGATNPTTLSGFGITDAQPLDSDLTAISGLTTNGIIVRTTTGGATTRTLTVSGSGIAISDADGIAGNPLISISSASTNTVNSLVYRDASGGFSAGTIVATLSGNASTATKLSTARSISITGDGSWTTTFDGNANATGALTLANTGVTAGTYPSVTVDAKGRVTGATSSLSISDDNLSIVDGADNTKVAKFQVSGITTGSTRVYTLPDDTGILINDVTTQTISGVKTFSNATQNIGSSTTTSTTNLGYGATVSGATKTINLGTGGASGSTTNINIGSLTSASTININGNLIARTTGSWKLPVGTTAQRDASPTNGLIRYNTDAQSFEGYVNGQWGGVGGAQANGAIYENSQSITTSYTITAGKNGMSAGPISIADGVTLTVPDGSSWVIL